LNNSGDDRANIHFLRRVEVFMFHGASICGASICGASICGASICGASICGASSRGRLAVGIYPDGSYPGRERLGETSKGWLALRSNERKEIVAHRKYIDRASASRQVPRQIRGVR
jgi:hypothetical protein